MQTQDESAQQSELAWVPKSMTAHQSVIWLV